MSYARPPSAHVMPMLPGRFSPPTQLLKQGTVIRDTAFTREPKSHRTVTSSSPHCHVRWTVGAKETKKHTNKSKHGPGEEGWGEGGGTRVFLRSLAAMHVSQ